MKRRIIALALALMVLLCWASPSTSRAYNRKGHDAQLEKVLFGNKTFLKGQEKKKREAITAMECAVYLCLDQYNRYGANELKTLAEYGVPGLPNSISVIDFMAGKEHRKYTHLGWNLVKLPEKGNWPVRKEIVWATVNKVFDFGSFTDPTIFGLKRSYTKQCDAFCALIYYVHILGDLEEMKDLSAYKRNNGLVLPLARHEAGESNPDILWCLDQCLNQLFSKETQKNYHYVQLKKELADISAEARKLAGSTGGINTEEKFQDYKQYYTKTLEALSGHIPALLKQGPFFIFQ